MPNDPAQPPRGPLARRFASLVEGWRAKTGSDPSILRRCSHASFVDIVAMGLPAVPLVIAEIRATPDHLFAALPRIVGESVPFKGSRKPTVAQMCAAWVAWYDTRPGIAPAAELDLLSRHDAGWDGRMGAAASPASFRDAVAFARMLGPGDPPADAGIHADGNATLTFERPGMRASLRFLGGSIAAYAWRDGREWDGEVPFDGTEIPPRIWARWGAGGRAA